MDLRTNRNALKLFREIYDYRRTVTPALVTQPQKPAFDDSQPLLQPFPRSSPEAQGVPSEQISRFLAGMNEDATLDLHGVMVIRNGHVIAEANFGAYDQRIWHITHSGCKSITGLAIGMLINEGRLSLDDRIQIGRAHV